MTVGENSLLCGRYRIQRSIGRGGMAEVYQAFDLKRQASVAVKVLREDVAEEPDFGKRFRREAEALAKLDHPNIVHYYAFEQDGPVAFIVMDFIEGTTLRRRIADAKGPLPLDEVTSIVRDLCAALHYAHQNGFAHRDLKPGNIMLAADGHALLADFGISCALEGITHTAASLGTPAYMSPEQIECGPADARSDIYSLGVLMFEMVTGRRPFTGEEPGLTQTGPTARVREAHVRLPPPDPRGLNPYLSHAAAEVILRALAKGPEGRWPDVLSLRRAWEAATGARTAGDIPLPPKNSSANGGAAKGPKSSGPPPEKSKQGWYDVVLPGPGEPHRRPSWLPYAAGAALLILALVLVVASRKPPAPPMGAPAGSPPTGRLPTAVESAASKPTHPPASGGGVVVQGGGRTAPPAAEPSAPSPTTPRSGVIVNGGRQASPTPPPGRSADEPTAMPTLRAVPVAAGPTVAVRQPAQQGNPPAQPASPAQPRAGGVTLLRPSNGARIVGEGDFAWQPDPGFSLAAGEGYELIVWAPGDDPLTGGRSPVGSGRQTALHANLGGVESVLRLQSGSTYYWGVRLWREPGGAIRMLSTSRAFVYERAGSGSPFDSPLPPPTTGDGEK